MEAKWLCGVFLYPETTVRHKAAFLKRSIVFCVIHQIRSENQIRSVYLK
jgi:hypothetical protein